MQQGLLPLFPLQAVLLPGAKLPLHIFEDRYKEMIGEVIREHQEFGVILANTKGIVSTGCTALIEKVLREYPDGRMDIITAGHRRFEIVSLNEDRTFLRGEVDFFDDEEESITPPDLLRRALEGFNEFQTISMGEKLGPDAIDEHQLSFHLARAVEDLSVRQALLNSRSESARIRQLADFFPIHNMRQRRIQHVKTVAPRNGHGASGLK
jgi:Lon protease-like protein